MFNHKQYSSTSSSINLAPLDEIANMNFEADYSLS